MTINECLLCNLLNQNHVLMIHQPDDNCCKPNFALALIRDNYNLVKTSDNLNKLNTTANTRDLSARSFFPKHRIEKMINMEDTIQNTLSCSLQMCIT